MKYRFVCCTPTIILGTYGMCREFSTCTSGHLPTRQMSKLCAHFIPGPNVCQLCTVSHTPLDHFGHFRTTSHTTSFQIGSFARHSIHAPPQHFDNRTVQHLTSYPKLCRLLYDAPYPTQVQGKGQETKHRGSYPRATTAVART